MSFKIGQLVNFPKEVVNLMLDYQEKQGNKRDVKVFQLKKDADGSEGGFDWDLTPEGEDVWAKVIEKSQFDKIGSITTTDVEEEEEVKYKGELRGFPKEVVNLMLDYQEKQGNKRDVSKFEHSATIAKSSGGFTWDETPEGDTFWRTIINNRGFSMFYKKYPKKVKFVSIPPVSLSPIVPETLTQFYRMNREGVFSPSKATDNQCGLKGLKHYQFNLTLIVKDELDEMGFIIDHDVINNAVNKAKIFGSCEEMQRIIYKVVEKILPKNVLLAYKCTIKPLDFNAKAYIEYIQCGNPHYLSLLS